MAKNALLTDEQWQRIGPLLPEPKQPRKDARKPIDNRVAFRGILWVLRTGATWKEPGFGWDSAQPRGSLRDR